MAIHAARQHDRSAQDAPAVRPGRSLPRPIARLMADRRIRYLFTGGLAAAVFYATFAGTWLVVQDVIPYLVVVIFANIVSALTTYPIQRHMVFKATGPWLSGFLRFYAVTLWGLGFNLAALPFLVEIVGLHVLISQAIILVLGPLMNYQLHRRLTFRPQKANPSAPVQPQLVPSED